MDSATVNGVELEYEVVGSGEPVLLSSPAVPQGFVPLLSQPVLADRYRMIRYHRRGWAGSTHTAPPVSVADHAADAGGLLDHLGVRRVHVAGTPTVARSSSSSRSTVPRSCTPSPCWSRRFSPCPARTPSSRMRGLP
jgi:hypothetical protein